MVSTIDPAIERREAMYARITKNSFIGSNLFDHVWTPTLTNPPTVPAESLIAFNSYHANYLKAAGLNCLRILTDPTFFWIGNQPGVEPYASTPGLKALFMSWVQACVDADLPVLVSFRDRSASTIQPSVPDAPFHMAVSCSDEMVESYGQFLRAFCAELAAISTTLIMVNPNQEPNVFQYTRQGTVCGQASLVNPTVVSGTISIKLFGLTKLDIALASGRTPAQVASDINAAIAASGTYAGKVNACIMLNRLLITGTNTTNMLESVKTSSTAFGGNLGLRSFTTGLETITYVPGCDVSRNKKAAVERWNKIQARMLEYIREGAPLMTLVPIGHDFGTLEASLQAGMPGSMDRNVIYDVCHLYEPIISQQGQIGANQYLWNSPYPVTPPTITSRTTTVTRSTTGQVDPIDPSYTPLYLPGASTVSIPGYTYGTNYTVTNNAVTWVSGGPAPDATYPLTHQYYGHDWLNEKIAKPPCRVVDSTIVRGAGTTDVLPAGYVTLYPSVYNAAPNGILSITQGATTYVEGVNFTISGTTITWITGGPATGSTCTITAFVYRNLALQRHVINNGLAMTPSLASIASALNVAQPFASTGYSVANLRARIKLISDVAKRNDVRVIMGEFGMPKQSDNSTTVRTFCDQASNVSYYQDFVAALKDFGVPGLFWEIRSGAWGCFSLSGNDNGSTVSGISNSDLRQTWVANALGFTGDNPI